MQIFKPFLRDYPDERPIRWWEILLFIISLPYTFIAGYGYLIYGMFLSKTNEMFPGSDYEKRRLEEQAFRKQLKDNNHVLTYDQLLTRSPDRTGTLLQDAYSSLAWWTPDDVIGMAPPECHFGIPDTDLEFSQARSNYGRQCFSQYYSPDSENAFLLDRSINMNKLYESWDQSRCVMLSKGQCAAYEQTQVEDDIAFWYMSNGTESAAQLVNWEAEEKERKSRPDYQPPVIVPTTPPYLKTSLLWGMLAVLVFVVLPFSPAFWLMTPGELATMFMYVWLVNQVAAMTIIQWQDRATLQTLSRGRQIGNCVAQTLLTLLAALGVIYHLIIFPWLAVCFSIHFTMSALWAKYGDRFLRHAPPIDNEDLTSGFACPV